MEQDIVNRKSALNTADTTLGESVLLYALSTDRWQCSLVYCCQLKKKYLP